VEQASSITLSPAADFEIGAIDPVDAEQPRSPCSRTDEADRDARAEWLTRSILPHEPWLRRKLVRLGVADDLLNDVIQDTYVRLLNAEKVGHIRDCRSYFARTARSVVLTRVRRAACVSEEAVDQSYFAQLCSPEAGPDAVAEARGELAVVHQRLSEFSARSRRVVMLRRFEELSGRETAKLINMSQSAVEKQLASVMCELRQALAQSPETSSWKHATTKLYPISADWDEFQLFAGGS
jgi:RNA polymerase sigma factor (sigma-70 family)